MWCPQGAGRSIVAWHLGREPVSPEQSCWAAQASRCWVKTAGGYLLSELGCSRGSCGSSCAPAAASGSDPRVPPQLEHITRGGWPGRRQVGNHSHWEVHQKLGLWETGSNQRQCSLHLGCMFITSSSGLSIGDAFYVHFYRAMFPWDCCLYFWLHHNPNPALIHRLRNPQRFLKTELKSKTGRHP